MNKRHQDGDPTSVSCFILTVSDTRTKENDESGHAIRDYLGTAGHKLLGYQVVPDDPDAVAQAIREAANVDSIEVVLVNGGTGITSRDSTFEAIENLVEKELSGFGELFRSLSYEEVGAKAMLSRAVAGTFQGKMLFSLPGSPGGVRLAMKKLILPTLGHIIGQLKK